MKKVYFDFIDKHSIICCMLFKENFKLFLLPKLPGNLHWIFGHKENYQKLRNVACLLKGDQGDAL